MTSICTTCSTTVTESTRLDADTVKTAMPTAIARAANRHPVFRERIWGGLTLEEAKKNFGSDELQR